MKSSRIKRFHTLWIIFLLSQIIFSQEKISLNYNDSKFISDNSIGNSIQEQSGNRNGNIDAGEQIKFQIALKAEHSDFISTSAFVSCTNKNIKILNPQLSFNDIKSGFSVIANELLVVEISNKVEHNEHVILDFKIIDSQKRDSNGNYIEFFDEYQFIVSKVGPIQYGGAIIDDDSIGQSRGDGDGVIEKSDEDIEIPLKLKNLGTLSINNVEVKLSSSIPNVRIVEDTHKYNFVNGSAYGETAADYVFYIDERGPNFIDFIPMTLAIKGTYNDFVYNWVHEFKLGNTFGYLDLSEIDNSIKIVIDRNEVKDKRLKYITGTDVNLAFFKNGFEKMNKTIRIKENMTTTLDVNLKESPKPLLDYIPEKYQYDILTYVRPEDFCNKKGYNYFYKEPKKRREYKRPLRWGNLLVGALIGAAAEVAYVEGTNSNESENIAEYSGAFVVLGTVTYGIPMLWSKRKYKPINSNIEYNKVQKTKAIVKAKDLRDKDYQNQLINAAVVSKKKNKEIKIKNLEIEKQNELIKEENEVIKLKNEEIKKKNDIIKKENNSKKAIFKYKFGNGKWKEG